jgi:hypothetical protein
MINPYTSRVSGTSQELSFGSDIFTRRLHRTSVNRKSDSSMIGALQSWSIIKRLSANKSLVSTLGRQEELESKSKRDRKIQTIRLLKRLLSRRERLTLSLS